MCMLYGLVRAFHDKRFTETLISMHLYNGECMTVAIQISKQIIRFDDVNTRNTCVVRHIVGVAMVRLTAFINVLPLPCSVVDTVKA